MSLVDYGSSDESDSEASSVEKKNNVESLREKDLCNGVSSCQVLSDEANESNLFADLPLPKSSLSLGENALKLLNKRKNQPVKILLPSLNELQSGEDEEIKKKRPSTKGSGLFALLPAPRNVTNLVPNSVNNKLQSACKPKTVLKKKEPLPVLDTFVSKTKFDVEEDDLDINPSSFFFTSSDDNMPSTMDGPVPMSEESKSDIVQVIISPNVQPVNSPINISENESHLHSEINNIDNVRDVGNLNDEAIEKLCGTRARKRKGEISEEVIDINVDSMVGDAYMWLSKDLTKEHEHRGFKKAKNLSVVERRKHQITYLASQAKEKEMELRNQWANSRMTRKQTQSKYGF